LAIVTFGEDAVKEVLSMPKWKKKYETVIESIQLEGVIQRDTILPGEIIYEIAGRDECKDDYYADPDGIRLYAVDRNPNKSKTISAEKQEIVKIQNQEALIRYGAYCLFSASDKGVGSKGEQGLPKDQFQE
jgi:hypothetical protein